MKRPWLPIVLWLIFLSIAGGWVAQRVEISHNLQAFFPDRGRPVETLLITKANSGVVSRMVFAAFEGGGLEQRLAASREAAARFGDHGAIETVANGRAALDLEAFEPLFPYRYLLGEAPPFEQTAIKTALEARIKELRSPLGVAFKDKLASDPSASFRTLMQGWNEGRTAPPEEEGLWVTEDRKRSLLFLILADNTEEQLSDERRDEAAVIASIRARLSDIADRHGVQPLLAGRAVLIAEAGESVRASLVYGSITASLLVVSLLVFVYRSFGILLLGALPLLTGFLAGLFSVLLIFGPIHGIALAFGITLIGITIDYPLHLFSHAEKDTALLKSAAGIERPVFLSAISTAGAFGMFGAGSAPGLGQLACFVAFGILAAALTLRYVVPALADLFAIRPSPRRLLPLPNAMPRAAPWLVILLTIASATVLISRGDRLFEADVGVLNPLPEAAKQRDQQLRGDLGAPDLRHLFLISGDRANAVLKQSERLVTALETIRQAGGIAGFDAPSRYLPSLARQKERQASLPASESLAALIEAASTGLPFKPGLFQPFLQAIDDSKALAPLDGDQGFALLATTPLGARLDQLLLKADGRWYGFIPIIGVQDLLALQSLSLQSPKQPIDQPANPSASTDTAALVELIDLKALSENILSDFRGEAFFLLGLGAGIVILLLALYRYPLTTILKIFLVLGASVIIAAAALVLLGETLTMLHILAVLLVVGLGLDYTIFFTWPDADREQRRRTRHALLTCVLSTVLVFGLLAFSSIGLLRAIGLTVALGACTTFAVAYTLLSRPYEE